MRTIPVLVLLAAVVLASLAPLRSTVASAQPEETPILGEPVEVTPIWTTAPGDESNSGSPEPTETGAPVSSSPSASRTPAAPTDSLPVAAQPDRCEPNDRAEQPCSLPIDAVSGPFTFVPDGDVDVFRLELPAEPSIQTVISARATDGLDLALSVRQGSALVASGTISLTLPTAISGTVLLQIENRDPRPSAGEQYRVEVRREIVPPSQEPTDAPLGSKPDDLENNWSFATAAPIAVGVVYDLSFVCPEARPNACPGGDHDYLIVPVKAGVAYLLTTFDLDPGVDTVVELFWGSDTAMAVAGNDDYAPGGALSALNWTAPSDGLLGVRVAPRNGGLAPRLATTTAAYRFAVAPIASELARKLDVQIRQQANVPSPTPTAAPPSGGGSSGGSPSGGAGGGPAGGGTAGASTPIGTQETIVAGSALIVRETVLRREPSEQSTALATLAPETVVAVRGAVRGLWINVESDASILPGWVRWSDLQRVPAAASGTPSASIPASGTAISQQSPVSGMSPSMSPSAGAPATGPTAQRTPEVVVAQLDPVLPAPLPPVASRVPFALSVVVVATDSPPTGGGALGFATPTPDMRQPVGQVRVQLVSVFGDVLAEGVTDAGGRVELRRAVRAGDVFHVRVPAWGVELPLSPDQTTLVLTVPEAPR